MNVAYGWIFCVHTCQGALQKQLRVHSRVKKWYAFTLKHLRTCLPTESDTSPNLRSIDARARGERQGEKTIVLMFHCKGA